MTTAPIAVGREHRFDDLWGTWEYVGAARLQFVQSIIAIAIAASLFLCAAAA
eukprot:CAMPEP_0201977888 /NCGR_PEP_ID=MMETSP0904-20121228/62127_1 /ASSEMBLY_ACC=CAM_ASM_000553 /TAXON_ID=420261 /ORGANISM="Thalassiosira antarctica, Strain CCMP982" /LENGTH=51 /DNA_ID=CAMNT_0048529409 /DNA_START=1 /DNA_END=152 /DNA_ORIENTATION=+